MTPTRLLALSTLAMAVACAPSDAEHKVAGAEAMPGAEVAPSAETALVEAAERPDAGAEDCLLMVWSNQNRRDIEFDRANDLVQGGAISCATGTSASRFDAALDALREAARAGDRTRVMEQVGLPLLFIDRKGNRVELTTEEEVEAVYDQIFQPELLRMLERIDLAEMTVVPEKGGFFELGALWLVVEKNGGRPRLVTVNQQALGEAAEAARRKSKNRQGELVPVG
ncbi:MAG: hypothetical protein ACR2FJ_07610 [Qipengyuania sp.]